MDPAQQHHIGESEPVVVRLMGKNLYYYCPGCKHGHSVDAERWHWDGDEQCPTLSPSVRHFIISGPTTCHYFVRNGQIQYCGDCQHDLAGQTVPLPRLNDNNEPIE